MNGVVSVAALTGRGLVRRANEDRIGVFGWTAPVQMSNPALLAAVRGEPLVVVIADGMGGHPAGAVASQYAVTELMERPDELTDAEALRQRCVHIHGRLLQAGIDDPRRRGMGTTLSAVVVTTDDVLLCNVGDSRIYYVEPGLVDQLTTDDVDPFGAGTLIQVLGGDPGVSMKPQVSRIGQSGSLRLLLCSDGLHGYVPVEEIRRLAAERLLLNAAAALQEAVCRAGAPDNVSLCLVEIVPDHSNEERRSD